MAVHEIIAKSILRKQKRVDSWFISSYGMNLYRGCLHDCCYCDGRAEKYRVDGSFGKDVFVKSNAQELLLRELNPKRKRKPMSPGFIMLGGGVNDSYQSIEKKYRLSRKALEIIHFFKHPVHILTKSTLVEEDLDLIQLINEQTAAIVSFSFSTVDDRLGKVFEPGVPSPSERLKCMEKIKSKGIACGMYLMPVIPFITDTEEKIEESISMAKKAGTDFIIFGGMTLKPGRQKQHYLNSVENFDSNLLHETDELYKNDDPWGNANNNYYKNINKRFYQLAKKYQVPMRIPYYLFDDILPVKELSYVMLDHIHYLLKYKGIQSGFGKISYKISQLENTADTRKAILEIATADPAVKEVVKEILDSGKSAYYNELL